MKSFVRLTLPLIVLILSWYAISYAQDPQSNSAPPQDAPDLLGKLRLSPDQIQRIRLIQRDTKDERATIQQHLREANRALEESLDSENVDESVIDQRMQDVNAAKNAKLGLKFQKDLKFANLTSAFCAALTSCI